MSGAAFAVKAVGHARAVGLPTADLRCLAVQALAVVATVLGTLLTALLLLLLPRAAQAEMHALLVGVSGYAVKPLTGPRNDVPWLRQVLLQRDFKPAQITVLADGVPDVPGVPRALDPTRARILQALDSLAARAAAGDTVLLYFTGHGSWQAADTHTSQGRAEPDGRHETFLPLDTGRWDGKGGWAPNALVDFELRDKVDRIGARGAFVWAVFDACHSASLVRGGGQAEERVGRFVDPADLGVPEDLLAAAAHRAEGAAPAASSRGAQQVPGFTPGAFGGGRGAAGAGSGGGGPGGAVYFYAAQANEATTEQVLPPGSGQRHGLFSHVLIQALEKGRPMTYRQLGQHILARYGSMNEALVTPLFGGTALDQPVLGQTAPVVRQWPLLPQRAVLPAGERAVLPAGERAVPPVGERAVLPVGELQGLAEGALFAVVPDALSPDAQALAYLRASQVDLQQTTVEAVAHAGKPARPLASLPAGAQARLLSSPERYALRLAVDAKACPGACRWLPALARLRADGVPGADIQWVGRDADLVLRLTPTAVRLLSPAELPLADCRPGSRGCPAKAPGTVLLEAAAASSAVPSPAAVAAAAEDVTATNAAALAERLHAAARATNLLRLAARLALQGPGNTLRVTVSLAPAAGGPGLPLSPEGVQPARPGDRLVVALHNAGGRPTDVTLLYADAHHGIDTLHPRRGELNRLMPGDRLLIDDIGLSDANGVFGIERLLVIAVDAHDRYDRADFSHLAQPPLRAARARGRAQGEVGGGDVGDDEVGAFFDAVFAGHRSRGEPPRMPGSRTAMQVFTVDVAPAAAPGKGR